MDLNNLRLLSNELAPVLSGDESGDNLSVGAKLWLELTIYMLAESIAFKETEQERQAQADYIKQKHPDWFDDVFFVYKLIANSIK